MASKKLLIDTNVIIDLLDDKRIFHNESKKLIRQCLENDIEMVITDDIITTVYYLSQRYVAREKLLEFIRFLTQNFEVIAFDAVIINESVDLCLTHAGYDFEDTLQAVCAIKNGIEVVITNDRNFPVLPSLRLCTSENFFSYLSDQA